VSHNVVVHAVCAKGVFYYDALSWGGLWECSLKLHLTTSELWFGQEQEGILPELLSSSRIV